MIVNTLESWGVGEGQTCMSKPVDPSLRHRLGAFDRSDVVRFSIVVPSQDLGNIDGCTVLDKEPPPFG
jgi:hypothetical protein